MGDKFKPRHFHNNNPRFQQEGGLISKNDSRKDKREKRNRSGYEWKRERESS